VQGRKGTRVQRLKVWQEPAAWSGCTFGKDTGHPRNLRPAAAPIVMGPVLLSPPRGKDVPGPIGV
jgi:hypothetical protein